MSTVSKVLASLSVKGASCAKAQSAPYLERHIFGSLYES